MKISKSQLKQIIKEELSEVINEKMQIPAPVIKKCLALAQKLVDDVARTRYSAVYHPEEAEIAQAEYAELQAEYDSLRCDDTLERAEAYGDLEHFPPTEIRPWADGPVLKKIPGKTKLKR